MNIYLDFETRSPIDLRKVGAHKYFEPPDFDILMTAFAMGDSPATVEEGLPNHLIPILESPYSTIIAHNAAFERGALLAKNIYTRPEQWICTAQIARSLAFPPSLGKLATFLGVEQKDSAGTSLINLFCKPGKYGMFTEGDEEPLKWAAFLEYCRQDVVVLQDIYSKLSQYQTTDRELEMRNLDSHINSRGVPIDLSTVQKAKDMAEEITSVMADEFTTLTGIRYSQRDKVLSWLKGRGIDISDMTIASIRGIDTEKLTPEVLRAVGILRRIKKTSLKKLDTMLRAACEDDTVKGTLLYHGATTGRWSGRLIQPQNFPRPVIKDVDGAITMIKGRDIEGIKSLGNPLDALASCLRGMIKAPKGYRLLVSDFKSIEAAGLVYLAGQQDKLKLYFEGEDLYAHMAAKVFNVSLNDVTPRQRTLGKIAVLGSGYGTGPKKFHSLCEGWGVPISEDLAATTIATFREDYHKVVSFWKVVDKSAKETIRTRQPRKLKSKNAEFRFFMKNNHLFITLPSGRNLCYPNAKLVAGVTPWGDHTNEIRFYGNITHRVNWGNVKTYGAKITENICQAFCRDLLAESMLNLGLAGYQVSFHVHDEIVCLSREDSGQRLDKMERIMKIVPEWANGVYLECEGYTSERYKK